MSLEPTKKNEEIAQAEAYRQFNNYTELRRSRLANITTGIPGVFWWVVALGAFITILLLAMLDMEIHVHLILTGLVSLFLGLVIFLIAAMDNPFRGEVSVGPGSVRGGLSKPDEAGRFGPQIHGDSDKRIREIRLRQGRGQREPRRQGRSRSLFRPDQDEQFLRRRRRGRPNRTAARRRCSSNPATISSASRPT